MGKVIKLTKRTVPLQTNSKEGLVKGSDYDMHRELLEQEQKDVENCIRIAQSDKDHPNPPLPNIIEGDK